VQGVGGQAALARLDVTLRPGRGAPPYRVLRSVERSPLRRITTLAAALLLNTASATGIQQPLPHSLPLLMKKNGYATVTCPAIFGPAEA
jgi:hypothetical protein